MLLGGRLAGLCHPDDRAGLDAALATARDDRPTRVTCRLRSRSGRYV
jgi:hypothetical protein